MNEKLLEIQGLSKFYPGVVALKDVSFDIYRNTVHCIVGENGAGKSTLIKILTGALRRNAGRILYDGKEFSPHSTRDAMNAGMSVLFQELNVVDQLSVEQNLTLGLENSTFGFERKSTRTGQVLEVLRSLDPTIAPQQRVGELSVAQKQVIEITKAISSDSSIIVMDEPTAALSEEEVERLFAIVKNLRHQNVTVIYITHRLAEIFRIGDFVTVLRDGQMIGTRAVSELAGSCASEVESCAELIRMMLGKVVAERYVPSAVDRSQRVLELNHVNSAKLRDVGLELYKGEILGVYGLIGSGKTEIARAIYGLDEVEGEIRVHGRLRRLDNPAAAIASGIAMVPEERRTEGLCTKLSIRENIPVMNMKAIAPLGITSRRREKGLARGFIEKVRIVARDEEQKVALLSGGNQQKVVFAKCLNARSAILLLDEPTRGVDVGAKEEIHNIVRELSRGGTSVIVFSSELPEILNLCDRIILLYQGRVKQVLANGSDIDSEKIMHVVTGAGEAGNAS
jgi:ABC-type sugar transport system ATPase subunit